MRIMTILGTRPEIIRLSLIIRKLDQWADRHVVVHTGQNFTASLSGIFFEQLELRPPDYVLLDQHQSLGGQLATMFREVEALLLQERPDKVLVLGDTNSALCAILAERLGFQVIHMEAGNRCFDLSVPEEKNRRIIDTISSINMPYTEQSKKNLVQEGFPTERIVVTGNPIYEVLQYYSPQIEKSKILEQLGLTSQQYLLVTTHRAENVDHPDSLNEIMEGLSRLADKLGLRVICSIHPRTKLRIHESLKIQMHPLVEFHEPFGFFDFVKLEQHARLVLTDSGTVQEECCIFQVPTVTIRNSTERPETIDCGSNVVCGVSATAILEAAVIMTAVPSRWECPAGYLAVNVSDKVIKFLLGGKLHV